jgi:hypothetical protein
VLGVPKWAAWLKIAETATLLVIIGILTTGGLQLQEVAWTLVGVQIAIVPVGMHLIASLLGIRAADRIRVVWRPLLGAALMATTIWLVLSLLPPVRGFASAAVSLAATLPTALIAFAATVYATWRMSGKPPGPEALLLDYLNSRKSR